MTPSPDLAQPGEPQFLHHGRMRLALHQLRAASDPSASPLLLLHALGCKTDTIPSELSSWSGAVFGLDFTGHGESTCPAGGGYTAEVLMGDADTALRTIGPAVIVGAGLGGYVGLLVAGAAPQRVRGVVVTGGAGLAGGAVRPGSETISMPGAPLDGTTPDPFALLELATDVRPPNYIASFVRRFVEDNDAEHPVWICTAARPAWLGAVSEEFGVGSGSVAEALESLAMGKRSAR